MVLSLYACGSKPDDNADASEDTAESNTEDTTEDTTEEVTEEVTEAVTEEVTEPPIVYRHPLTGEPLEAPFDQRISAVTVNNAPSCLPQSGIADAEVIYEAVTEGGATRFLALFSDIGSSGVIGPVRSTRTFFNCIAVSYDAALIHCGGSKCALRGEYDISGDTIDNWVHLNATIYENTYFYRDRDRYNSGYAWEHCLFTTGEEMTEAFADLELGTTYENGSDYGLTFSEDVQLNGEPANVVTVNFKGGKTTTMTYNPDAGLYEAAQYGQDLYDADNGEYLSFKNVLVLYADHWGVYDGADTHSYYTIIGSGEGVYACNGQLIPILWQHDTLRNTFTYTYTDGTPLDLGIGTSYIAIASNTTPADYE